MDSHTVRERPPERERVERAVMEIVVSSLGLDTEDVSLESTFEELRADISDRYYISLRLEIEFRMPFFDDEVRRFVTVGDAVRYVLDSWEWERRRREADGALPVRFLS